MVTRKKWISEQTRGTIWSRRPIAPVAVETIGDLYEAGRDIGGRAVIGRDHLRVLLFWAAMLGGLYILQTFFS